jgi:hypothetical protein
VKTIAPFFLLLFLFCFFSGCCLYDPAAFLEGRATVIGSKADQVVLLWDAPISTISKYIVSFRIHGETNWTLLQEVSAPTTELLVLYSQLGDGDFDFAVVAENSIGERSEIHSSLDETAEPSTGWYLHWKK